MIQRYQCHDILVHANDHQPGRRSAPAREGLCGAHRHVTDRARRGGASASARAADSATEGAREPADVSRRRAAARGHARRYGYRLRSPGRHPVIAPDVNVLLYAFREESERHEEFRGWLESALGAAERVALFEPVLASVVRIATHPGIYRTPAPRTSAEAFVDACLASPAA